MIRSATWLSHRSSESSSGQGSCNIWCHTKSNSRPESESKSKSSPTTTTAVMKANICFNFDENVKCGFFPHMLHCNMFNCSQAIFLFAYQSKPLLEWPITTKPEDHLVHIYQRVLGTGRHNLRSFLTVKSIQNYFLIARVFNFCEICNKSTIFNILRQILL